MSEGAPRDYIKYLSEFFLFDDDWQSKDLEYQTYLTNLLSYLVDFYRKSEPLEDHSGFSRKVEADFEQLWVDGFQSWKSLRERENVTQNPSLVPKSEKVDKTIESTSDKLYCQYCKRKFAKKSVFDAHLPGKKHLKAVEISKKKSAPGKEMARLEFSIFRFGLLFQKTIERTIRNIEGKLAKTWEELLADMEDESGEEELSSEDDEEPDDIIQGIRDYPVGWDGKPIPYWLYKLHGLGVEYKCEICGNASYMGRRNYEKHFQEWRHTEGLRCFGIPNTKHFSEITKIKDALELHKKIQIDRKAASFDPDEHMEYEDNEGNVVSKKTYELMKRQGLI